VLADLQGLMDELRKNQAEIAANQEQSDANLRVRITELEQKLEEYNVERQQVEARLCELEEQNIKREEVEKTLRDRVTVLEEKLKERDLEREVKATFSGYTKGMEREGKPQESDAHSRQVGFDFSGHLEKLERLLEETEMEWKCTDVETNEEQEEDEIFMDALEDCEYFEEPERRERKMEIVIDELEYDEYFEEPERRERKMESEFEQMFHDESKELKNEFERIPRYVAYIRVPFVSVFFKDYKGTRIPWKFFGFLANFSGFGLTEDYEEATPTG